MPKVNQDYPRFKSLESLLQTLLMVTGELGAPGEAALKLVGQEQEQDLGSATILLPRMEGGTAVDHLVQQKLATEFVQVNNKLLR